MQKEKTKKIPKSAIAHISLKGNVQTVYEHSMETARMSSIFAIPEMSEICKAIGILHDIGKYQPSFQKRILGAPIQVEHSICGAKEAIAHYGKTPIGFLTALCVAGHHSGIPDCGGVFDTADQPSLYGRLKRNTESFKEYTNELNIPKLNADQFNKYLTAQCSTPGELIEAFAFLTRYCFSCLTDADTIDTMKATDMPTPKPLKADFNLCLDRINKQLASFRAQTLLQKARSVLQQQAFENIKQDAEIYLMEMPTGSGKTLASMKCALARAVKTDKKRIIYVIPYNSIIDQTYEVLTNLFDGSAQILRHQSSFSYETTEDINEDYRKSAIYGCENWDAPIIVTTAVQFFESLYGNRRGKLRKVHNMADSIIVFDEAHLMPIPFLQPCLRAIAFITKYLHSEAIFLTATMPDFGTLIREYALRTSTVKDLVPDHSSFIHFKKCTYEYVGTISDEKLIQAARQYASSLIVVNSRKAAQTIFQKCPGTKYHLSTYMTAYDRTRVIAQVRDEIERLKKDYPDQTNLPEARKIVVISTSLIEAGVDLDFNAAFRELNGLDNVLQTGGRCNREGILPIGHVYVFRRHETRTSQNMQSNIMLGIIRDFNDMSSDAAIKEYYQRLFNAESALITKNSMEAQCKSLDSIPFRTYSENMHLIDSNTISVVYAQDDKSKSLLETARHTGYVNARDLQKYCLSVRPNEMEQLVALHAIEEIGGIPVLIADDYYEPDTGVRLEGKDYIV